MSSQESSNTVLAQATIDSPDLNPRWSPNYKQKIVEFYGFEGEDFRHFRALLESFFAINGITQDSRKVIILRSQLRRAAAIFFQNDLKLRNLTGDSVTYDTAIKLLQDRFLSKDLLEEYEYAFQSMKQTQTESPQMYLSRLYEAADLADIQDDKMIFSRFRAGLLSQIITFCKEQAATSHKDWVKNSNAWWNAHATRPIHLVDNPFVAGSYNNGNNAIKFNSERTKNDTMVSLKSHAINENHKPYTEAYANVISPSIASLTAKLEALELHSLIPGNGSNEKIDNDTIQTTSIKSLLSDNEFKSFVKNIVQEVHNEKVAAYIPYKNNRKSYYNNDNHNEQQGNPSYQRNYRNNNYNNNMNEGNNGQSQQHENSRYNNNYNNGHGQQSSYNNNRSNYNQPPRNNYNNQGSSLNNTNQNGQQQRYNQNQNNNYPQNNYNHRNNYNNENTNSNNNQKN